MIRQVRTISFKASSFHPIHPLAKWTHCVPWPQLESQVTIKNSGYIYVTLFEQWTMLGEYPLTFQSATS